MKFLINSFSLLRTQTVFGMAALWFVLSNCTQPLQQQSSPSNLSGGNTAEAVPNPSTSSVIWSDGFDNNNWENSWKIKSSGSWGLDNAEVISDPTGRFNRILRVRYPAGSASPSVSREQGVDIGGMGFYANLGIPPTNALRLSYFVRFPENFDFVKGGKLPGLFGGTVTSGGDIPDGTNGFSTRLMWRRQGEGEVYAYLPSSEKYGTSIGRGAWQFQPGVWYHVEQEVILNQPNQEDGRIRVWINNELVLNRGGLVFRTTDRLKIEGIFFSTFFGGGDPSWSTPKDVYTDFADFSVSAVTFQTSSP